MSAPPYSRSPPDAREFTRRFDRAYTTFGGAYDRAVRLLPVWRRWLDQVLPHLRGPRVLEVSFGTGYLLTRYAGDFETHGIDYNERMIEVADANLARCGARARLLRADVLALPYGDAAFDCIVNTMALSGYPDAGRALAEMRRVLRPEGRLVLIDVGFPADRNRLGMLIARGWQWAGDLVRDTHALLEGAGFTVRETMAVGGCGSVQLFIAERPPRTAA